MMCHDMIMILIMIVIVTIILFLIMLCYVVWYCRQPAGCFRVLTSACGGLAETQRLLEEPCVSAWHRLDPASAPTADFIKTCGVLGSR